MTDSRSDRLEAEGMRGDSEDTEETDSEDTEETEVPAEKPNNTL